MTRGTRGKLYKKYVKEWYYECDLNLRGDGKLTQTKLSFPKMTPDDRKMRGGGADDSSKMGSGFCTSTEGQTTGSADDGCADTGLDLMTDRIA